MWGDGTGKDSGDEKSISIQYNKTILSQKRNLFAAFVKKIHE